jgi:uncharacterized protein (DUF952 family)
MAEATPKLVYKILPERDWREAVSRGRYEGSADDTRDGFIHLSTREQLASTAAKHFQGQTGLVVVALDVGRLGSALRWEPSRGGELFPHLFASLDPSAAIRVDPLGLGPDGVPVELGI